MKIRTTEKILLSAAALFSAAALLTACGSHDAVTYSTDSEETEQTSDSSGAEERKDYTDYTDEEFLADVQTWQNKAAPGVIYTFHEDGTGQLTVDNNRNIYGMAWSAEDGILKFEMENWPYTDDVQLYTVSTDKENVLFVSYNDEGSEAVFVPLGTVPFPSYEDSKPEELLGAWLRVPDDAQSTTRRVWYLQAKEERSGYGKYYTDTRHLYLQSYFDDWNTVEGSRLVFVFENGTEQSFTYELDGSTMNLTGDDGETIVFEKLDLNGVEINE